MSRQSINNEEFLKQRARRRTALGVLAITSTVAIVIGTASWCQNETDGARRPQHSKTAVPVPHSTPQNS